MDDRYFLYIDILGFKNLSNHPEKIKNLFAIIDKLNIFEHYAFKGFVFSDTIIVYNEDPPHNEHDHQYLVMYLCEFAQQFFYELITLDIHFRAILRHGQFNFKKMTNIHAFYGEALISSYVDEKDIQCMGLFIQKSILSYCNIFKTVPFNDKYYFVNLMQGLDISVDWGVPMPECLVIENAIYRLAYDICYLKKIYEHSKDFNLENNIRTKYITTWHTIRHGYPELLDTLERNDFLPESICETDWTEAINRVGTNQGQFG